MKVDLVKVLETSRVEDQIRMEALVSRMKNTLKILMRAPMTTIRKSF